ncbi:GDP-L-fucose synthase family protein [Paracoccus sp. P2]|uniref:GDP-L-fucose synthase n=1 Tax=Paracoccus pantotrophus TaxID=82367 RepID=A0A7H9BQR1_PARPN|nr:GDP-L-fucose synthase [Paracoccus pantotrophus]MDF3854289.1 GDP-L-fucose synthase [Paracoccus pantotrophus]QLH13700.1 GDP-L-fucose synthase [Paracoccus pantotrophus]RDE00922.1 GDP-L-fucose synthase [Paracoccus pantotrophus]RNI17653.1 GDP-L-fucose synthase [Paracoccus pantotrophus]WGR67137.1 GDP-L-fucose synthase [Paracoccus pantotrophus]
MARLFITGGHGMVGRNLRAHPGIAAWQVLAPARTELDLCDADALRDWLARHRPDAVVHAAGVVGGIQANLAEPMRYLIENARIGLNLIAACREARIPVLINLSSSCVYPRDLHCGLAEEQILTGPLEPSNEGYALAKIMAMRLVDHACREDRGLQWRTLVPCNLYGPFDKFDPGQSHLLPAIIHKIHRARVEGHETVEIWGDGTARREFMHAGDLAEAILRALAGPSSVPAVMNIGPGVDHAIDDYYRIAAGVIGWQGRFVHDLGKPVGMRRKLLSVTRQTEWGWAPQTGLREGIAATYAWYLEHQP